MNVGRVSPLRARRAATAKMPRRSASNCRASSIGMRSSLVRVVLGDRVSHRLHRQIVFGRRRHRRRLASRSRASRVDVLELFERRPAGVVASPIESGRQPHRERLGEIFVGMLLRVPAEDVPDVSRENGSAR